jgi:YD repeat-containing protein
VSFVRTPDGQLIAATSGTSSSSSSSSSAYYLTDNLGSTVGIVNGSGVKTAAYAYDPYGRTRTATGTAANAFRYAGGLFEPPPAPPNSVPATTTPTPAASPNPTPAGRSKTPMHTQVTTPTITGIQTGLVSATS